VLIQCHSKMYEFSKCICIGNCKAGKFALKSLTLFLSTGDIPCSALVQKLAFILTERCFLILQCQDFALKCVMSTSTSF